MGSQLPTSHVNTSNTKYNSQVPVTKVKRKKPRKLMMLDNLVVTILVTAVATVTGQCSDNDTSIASIHFKDCMDQKQAALLQTNLETDNKVSVFCDGLDFLNGCEDVVTRFSQCKSRQYVE